MSEYETQFDESFVPIRVLSKSQRRALGALIEKAYTTPEYYPQTLKALTNSCNQKSNRSPVTNYTEDAVWQTMDELRELQLVTVLLPESGRTERYRHLLRKRYPFTEPQLAIMAELWCRGRQTLGELRTRASRMVPIENLEDLREELDGLVEQGYVQSTGDLARRGVEVDHAFYEPSEGKKLEKNCDADDEPAASPRTPATVNTSTAVQSPSASVVHSNSDKLEKALEELRGQHIELRQEFEQLQNKVEELNDLLMDLRQSLGA